MNPILWNVIIAYVQEKNKGEGIIKDAALKGDKTPFDAASFFIKAIFVKFVVKIQRPILT